MHNSPKEIILKREREPMPYNLSELRKMSNNDETFVKQTLNIFIENFEDAIRVFNQSVVEENWQKIGETGHKILPSCRHLAIDSIVQNLIEIKTKTANNEDHEEIAQLVKETVQEMGDIYNEYAGGTEISNLHFNPISKAFVSGSRDPAANYPCHTYASSEQPIDWPESLLFHLSGII
jgi:HPt (histidine-containing phosphotransfer) domain-containing protein